MQVMEYPPERSYAAMSATKPESVEDHTVPVVGDTVLYVLSDGQSYGQARPALIVRVWSAVMVNLQVFTDGANDFPSMSTDMLWRTSVRYSENKEPGTWHFSEKA